MLRHEPELRAADRLRRRRPQRPPDGAPAAFLPDTQVASSAEWGLPPLQVEATAFAWLARKTIRREKLQLESITGARGARVLGCVYPA